mmetsp:Transcript_1443/g.3371  ORF Transcript_1443/g.3371 Transcript_1443/m.3371 type:complete len:388 (+) Transcript_1443:215-1378(+)|eukprot:CAMPEP_0178995528 /NCGR_PEP_ID=MMETSP0795-20121207/7873_1 /TAXON_ID=88552 /ORGANISM="Amoebophrya sp., Strain Ameob2" /LENGTH=387 /DNA_ID=CAMNT_0020687837 /DNA_START=183 /DNA_END=1346 /DNA_ORIENTATION=-
MGNCSGKAAAPASPAAAAAPAPAAKVVSSEHKKLLTEVGTNFRTESILKPLCTADAWFQPPGAPKFDVPTLCGMMSGYNTAFPDWVSKFDDSKIEFVSETDAQIVYKCYTQQRIGCMKADLEALGPFPACTLADAPERAKAKEIVLPFEAGLMTIDKATCKLVSGQWTGELGDGSDSTTMDFAPPVGMKMLYEGLLGLPMPAPPKEVTPEHKELIVKVATGFRDEAILTPLAAEGCWLSPPGAPQFDVPKLCSMMSGYKEVWPDWVSKVDEQKIEFVSETDAQIVYKVWTQQRLGLMKADLPALEPFPACTLADAPARVKETETILPFESGLYTLDKASCKLVCANWEGEVGEAADSTTMDMTPPVGMGMLYGQLLGLPMPAPPAEA